jgi:hypothetical protein
MILPNQNKSSSHNKLLTNNTAFADLMCLSSTVPRDWRNGNALPQLNLLLRVCYRLSISLLNFLTGDVIINQPLLLKDLPLCQQYKKHNRPLDLIKIQESLEKAFFSSPPQTVGQVAQAIDYDKSELYRYFPDLCRKISARYKLYKNSPSN